MREVVEHVVGKADGVPMFVEELTKSVRESGLLDEQANRYALTAPLANVQSAANLSRYFDSLISGNIQRLRLPTLGKFPTLHGAKRELSRQRRHRTVNRRKLENVSRFRYSYGATVRHISI